MVSACIKAYPIFSADSRSFIAFPRSFATAALPATIFGMFLGQRKKDPDFYEDYGVWRYP